MRYTYSVIRFVPDSVRGEFVNIGIIAGSDAAGDWRIKTLPQKSHASKFDHDKVLPRVMERITALEMEIDAFEQSTESLLDEIGLRTTIDEEWLNRLVVESANLIQFSQPQPIIAQSAQHAIELLWDSLIYVHERRTLEYESKHRIRSQTLSAFREANIDTRRNVKQKKRLQTKRGMYHDIDYTVHNGHAVYLTQIWSFQTPKADEMLDDIMSWAWTIRDLRTGDGGVIIVDREELSVSPSIKVAAAYIPGDSKIEREAKIIFTDQDVQADFYTIDQLPEVGKTAASLLGITSL